MVDAALTTRALNRATLARQMLLARETIAPTAAIERLAGLQAQLARPPFIAFWSRLERFDRDALARLLHDREVVRATFLRGTLHLVSAKDYVRFRAALQPLLDRGMRSVLRDHIGDLDLPPLLREARAHLERAPRTFNALREHLVTRFPKSNDRAMGYAVRMQLPLVQVPTETAWGYPGTTEFAIAEAWLKAPLDPATSPAALVLRYFAAFGPATFADAQVWSGLAGLHDVVESLRSKLRVFRDPKGRELFDLPDAPRPPEDTIAPVRFLPEFDNLVMAYDDRARIVADAHRAKIYVAKNLQVLATFLVDGFVAGTWKIERAKREARLVLAPFEALSSAERDALEIEGEALLRFVEPDATTFDVQIPSRSGGARNAEKTAAKKGASTSKAKKVAAKKGSATAKKTARKT